MLSQKRRKGHILYAASVTMAKKKGTFYSRGGKRLNMARKKDIFIEDLPTTLLARKRDIFFRKMGYKYVQSRSSMFFRYIRVMA